MPLHFLYNDKYKRISPAIQMAEVTQKDKLMGCCQWDSRQIPFAWPEDFANSWTVSLQTPAGVCESIIPVRLFQNYSAQMRW